LKSNQITQRIHSGDTAVNDSLAASGNDALELVLLLKDELRAVIKANIDSWERNYAEYNPKVSVSRTARGGSWFEPESLGRRAPITRALFNPSSSESMAALHRTLNGDTEVMVKVIGGGRDSGTAQAHISYIADMAC
jgi:hypothetical protein